MPRKYRGRKRKPTTVYANDEQRESVDEFLEKNSFIEYRARLYETAMDVYLYLAERHGIDANWWPRIPELMTQVEREGLVWSEERQQFEPKIARPSEAAPSHAVPSGARTKARTGAR